MQGTKQHRTLFVLIALVAAALLRRGSRPGAGAGRRQLSLREVPPGDGQGQVRPRPGRRRRLHRLPPHPHQLHPREAQLRELHDRRQGQGPLLHLPRVAAEEAAGQVHPRPGGDGRLHRLPRPAPVGREVPDAQADDLRALLLLPREQQDEQGVPPRPGRRRRLQRLPQPARLRLQVPARGRGQHAVLPLPRGPQGGVHPQERAQAGHRVLRRLPRLAQRRLQVPAQERADRAVLLLPHEGPGARQEGQDPARRAQAGAPAPAATRRTPRTTCASSSSRPSRSATAATRTSARGCWPPRALHGPVQQDDCYACHDTHGSDYTKILKKFFPPEFYMEYKTENYAHLLGLPQQGHGADRGHLDPDRLPQRQPQPALLPHQPEEGPQLQGLPRDARRRPGEAHPREGPLRDRRLAAARQVHQAADGRQLRGRLPPRADLRPRDPRSSTRRGG